MRLGGPHRAAPRRGVASRGHGKRAVCPEVAGCPGSHGKMDFEGWQVKPVRLRTRWGAANLADRATSRVGSLSCEVEGMSDESGATASQALGPCEAPRCEGSTSNFRSHNIQPLGSMTLADTII